MTPAHNQPGRRFATGSNRADHALGAFGFFAHAAFFLALVAPSQCVQYLFWSSGAVAGVLLAIRTWQVGLTTTRESVKAIRDAWFGIALLLLLTTPTAAAPVPIPRQQDFLPGSYLLIYGGISRYDVTFGPNGDYHARHQTYEYEEEGLWFWDGEVRALSVFVRGEGSGFRVTLDGRCRVGSVMSPYYRELVPLITLQRRSP
jgi:hypothetical protein